MVGKRLVHLQMQSNFRVESCAHGWSQPFSKRIRSNFRESGVAPANQTKERAKRKSSWISPVFVNSGVFSLGKRARSTLNFCSGTPLRKVHELTFFGLVCRGHSWENAEFRAGSGQIPSKYPKSLYSIVILCNEPHLVGWQGRWADPGVPFETLGLHN